MGGSPPIPVDPVRSLPEAVLQQTPTMQRMQAPQQQQPQQQFNQYPPQQMPPTLRGTPSPMPFQQQSEGHQQYPQQNGGKQQRTEDRQQYQQQYGQSEMPQQRLQPSIQQVLARRDQQAPQQKNPPQMRINAEHFAPRQPQYTDQQTGSQITQPRQPTAMAYAQGLPPVLPQGMGPPSRGGQPDYGQLSRSVPHHTTGLPSQPPTRAATVAHHTPRRAPTTVHQTPAAQSSSRPPRTEPPTTVQPERLEAVPRPNPADSYLDRVEHDPELRQMLSGAPSKTVHTSVISSSNSRHYRSPSLVDKPLPDPFSQQTSHRDRQATRGPSLTQNDNQGSRRGHRLSLSDGLHAHSHAQNQIPDGDRYPAFPGVNNQGRSHSRRSSFGSVGATGFPRPLYVSQSCI